MRNSSGWISDLRAKVKHLSSKLNQFSKKNRDKIIYTAKRLINRVPQRFFKQRVSIQKRKTIKLKKTNTNLNFLVISLSRQMISKFFAPSVGKSLSRFNYSAFSSFTINLVNKIAFEEVFWQKNKTCPNMFLNLLFSGRVHHP